MSQVSEEGVITPPTKRVTPLPKFKLFIVFLMYMCDALSLCSISPYINEMTAQLLHLDSDKDKVLVGYYAGWITSAYYLGNFCFCFIWGWMSDKYGRRPIILSGIAACILCNLFFGFSKFYWMAVLSRLLYGISNANLGVYKTYLAEVTDATNQAKAFTIIGLSFGCAIILGPTLGGFLAEPAKNYPSLFGYKFFETFPFLLPNAVIAFLTAIGFVIGIFTLSESNRNVLKKKQMKKNEMNTEKELEENETNTVKELEDVKIEKNELDNGDMESLESSSQTVISPNMEIMDEPIITPTDETIPDMESDTITQELLTTKQQPKSIRQRIKEILNLKKYFNNEIFQSKEPLLTAFLYAMIGGVDVGIDALLPLWAWTPINSSGLGLPIYQISLLSVIAGVVGLLYQLTVSAKLTNWLGPLRVFQIGTLLCVPALILLPETIHFVYNKTLLFLIFALISTIRLFGTEMHFTAIFILVNNSVTFENMGKLNGIAQMMVAFLRLFAPALVASIFAFSISPTNPLRVVFFFDFRFTFYALAILSIVIIVISLWLPKSIDRPKKDVETEIVQ